MPKCIMLGVLLSLATSISPAAPTSAPLRGVVVEPQQITAEQIARWQRDQINAVAMVLDEAHPARAYSDAARLVAGSKMSLFYWIEIVRNPTMAQKHPEWMASIGTHQDWRRDFPKLPTPKQGEVVKAFPWVPIAYREAYDGHLQRIKSLLTTRAASHYSGLLLNDLQGGPSACGCGNLQCRWAIDYHVPSTTAKLAGDDIAARFLADVRKMTPGNKVVPIWTTECEDIDLPPDVAPGGKTTGLCGAVRCAQTTCPKAFAAQLSAVLDKYDAPLGLLCVADQLQRDAAHRYHRDFASDAVHYCDSLLPAKIRPEHSRLWLIIDGRKPAADQIATHEDPGVGAIFQTLVPLDQSYEPRLVKVK